MADAAVSLLRQWGWRERPPVASAVGDGIPAFATCGGDMPRPSALLHGAVATVLVFALVSLAVNHGGYRQRRARRPVRVQNVQSTVTPAPAAAEISKAAETEPASENATSVSILKSVDILAGPAILVELGRSLAEKLISGGANQPPAATAVPVSAAELVKTLMAYDRSGDGKVQRIEVPPSLLGLFALLDRDQDGELTSSEIRQAVEH